LFEVLTFLLDFLHEDLNLIRCKPYVPIRPFDPNLTDAQLAAIAWKDYKQRNDSIICDLFHGQLKSKIICPNCYKVSVTFDPFACIS
jgi:ubiquitin C-terminal hydrolase